MQCADSHTAKKRRVVVLRRPRRKAEIPLECGVDTQWGTRQATLARPFHETRGNRDVQSPQKKRQRVRLCLAFRHLLYRRRRGVHRRQLWSQRAEGKKTRKIALLPGLERTSIRPLRPWTIHCAMERPGTAPPPEREPWAW